MTYSRRTAEPGTVATVEHWTGFEAKQLRCALRLTVNDFAARLGVNPRTVNKWESRLTGISPLPEMQAALDTALGQASEDARERFLRVTESAAVSPTVITPIERAALTQVRAHCTANGAIGGKTYAGTVDFGPRTGDAARAIMELTGSDMATRRKFLGLSLLTGTALVAPVQNWAAAAAAESHRPDRVGMQEIEDLRHAVAVFRQWDAAGVGGLHRKAVVGQLNAVAEILRRNHGPEVRQRLNRVVAELAQLTGWMTFDAGMYGAAQRYFLHALEICKQTDSDLAAKVVGDMAQVSRFLGRHDDSLAMVSTALGTMPRHASQLVRSELLGHEACTYAKLGPSHAARACRCVEESIETFEQVPRDARESWNQYMDRAEVECLAGNVYIHLASHAAGAKSARKYAARAESHVLQALHHRSSSRPRSRLFDEIRLSNVRITQGEPGEAAEVARTALVRAEGMHSAKVVSRLIGICRKLSPRYGEVSSVAEFQDELVDYVRKAAPVRERELVA